MTISPPAGWHPDPATPGQMRWWDGKGWTDHTRPLPDAGAPDAYGAPVGSIPPPGPPGQPPPGGPGPLGVSATPYAPYGPSGVYPPSPYGAPGPGAQVPPNPRDRRTGFGMQRGLAAFRYNNSASLTALAFSAGYILLTVLVHFVLLGFLPLVMAVGAMRRHEKLAPVALTVAILQVLFAIAFFR